MGRYTFRAALIRQASEAEDADSRAFKVTKVTCDEELRNDDEIIVEAIKQSGCAIARALEELQLKDDKEVVIEAGKQNGLALAHAPQGLRDVEEVTMEVPELKRSPSDPLVSDLGHFRPSSTRFDRLVSSNFTVVRKIATGINGDIFQYRWRRDGERDVVVKRLRVGTLEKQLTTERNEREAHLVPASGKVPEAEDALTEIGVLSYLAKQPDQPIYLLRMLGVFSCKDSAWLVTEHCEGGELFQLAANGGLGEAQVKVYHWQVLQAVAYLHRHSIGHRDISLENVLLRNGVVRLMDFGMAVRSHTSSGTPLRFFRAVGKNYYRAPECYVPMVKEVSITAPAGSAPGAVVTVQPPGDYLCEVRLPQEASAGRPCRAEVWGYAAAPTDIFAAGVCIFILLHGNPPFGKALLCDQLFAYLYGGGGDQGLHFERLLKAWHKELPSADLMNLMVGMTQPQSSRRPTAADCLASACFADMAGQPAKLHSSDAQAATTPQGEATVLLGA